MKVKPADAGPVERPVRPDCYEFGMDFMGDPEETEIRAYVEALERWADAAVAAERERWRESAERAIEALRELERYEFATATIELRHAAEALRVLCRPNVRANAADEAAGDA